MRSCESSHLDRAQCFSLGAQSQEFSVASLRLLFEVSLHSICRKLVLINREPRRVGRDVEAH